jgi:hypothetical protein
MIACLAVENTACIFCGETGATVKITREHTFSDWINEVLTPDIVGPDMTFERSILHGPQAGTMNSWRVTQVASHKLRSVCQSCNSGWMSDLEGQVRPLIEPMIQGFNAPLDPEDQITVATWATLKAAVFEFVWTDTPVFTVADRQLIMTQNRPPAGVQVRLAAVESNGYPLRALGRGYELRATGDKALCLTITVGCLVVQVFGGPGAGDHAFQGSLSGPNFIGIYPPQMHAAAWPPTEALNDASLVEFAHPLAPLTDAQQTN